MSNLELALSLGWCHKQVLDLLHIDFDHLYLDLELDVGILVLSYPLEDTRGSLGYDTVIPLVAKGREGLTSTGLPVSEDSAVKTLPGLVKDLLSDEVPSFLLINIGMLSLAVRNISSVLSDDVAIVRPHGMIKGELAVFFTLFEVVHDNLGVGLRVD